jgi:hypothetical protein
MTMLAFSSAPWLLLGLHLLARLLIILDCWVVSRRQTQMTLERVLRTTAILLKPDDKGYGSSGVGSPWPHSVNQGS